MDAHPFQISGVIKRDTLLRIPYFQRTYRWGEKQWERFAIDMEATLESERDYFLGAVILKEEAVSREENARGITRRCLVIDGQQRLTTLAIYMKILYTMAHRESEFDFQYLQESGPNEPVIIPSRDDRPQFEKIMHLDALIENNDNNSIAKAYTYFKNSLDYYRDRPQAALELLNMIRARVTFVVISLTQEDDEQQIFDTINSLGVPLTTGELMKNFLYEAQDEDAYNRNWRPVFDAGEASEFWETDASSERQSQSKENTTIERFFHAFVRIKMWDFKDRLTEIQRKSFVKMENVFVTCKAFCNETFGMQKQELANEIIEYARLYKENLGPEVLDNRVPQHSGIKRISCLINATKNYAVVPYILYILRNVEDYTERNRIFGYLETYLIRRILCKSSNNDYSNLFTEYLIGQRKITFEGLMEYIEEKEGKALAMPRDESIARSLNSSKFDETTSRIIYYLYETKLTRTADNTITDGYNAYICEQFMPKTTNASRANWPPYITDRDREDRRQLLLATLGNYFLLDVENAKDLKKVHNAAFAAKLQKMRQWGGKIGDTNNYRMRSNQHLEIIRSWDEDGITQRNEMLAKAIKMYWPLGE